MVHLCVDARMIKNSGIGVYIRNYILYLLENEHYQVSLIGSEIDMAEALPTKKKYLLIKCDTPIYSVTEQLKLPFIIPACDIFWSPHYNIPILPIKATKRLVTIPDAAHLALSDTFEFSIFKRIYSKVVFRLSTILSDHISTISHFSKDEIIKFTATKPEKISVIHLGIDTQLFREITDPEMKSDVKKKYALPEKYILFVGNVKPHKNLRTLITSFHLIEQDIADYKVLIVGKKEGFITGDNQIVELIEKNGLSDKIGFTGYVPFKDLPYLYSLASLFVFPSIYEGFGFPPLEAMACGCPVVASDKASMPEICGNAVKYIDATNEVSLANGMLEMIKNVDIQKNYVKSGNIRHKQFTWESSGAAFAHLLKSIL